MGSLSTHPALKQVVLYNEGDFFASENRFKAAGLIRPLVPTLAEQKGGAFSHRLPMPVADPVVERDGAVHSANGFSPAPEVRVVGWW